MINHTRATVFLALLTFILSASPALGKALEDRNWIEVRTANFQVRSLSGEKDTIKLARRLEMFRAAVAIVTNVNSTDVSIPTEIYALRRGRDFKHFGLDHDFGGEFMAGLRSNTVLLRDANSMEEATTILHEYVHFLVSNHGRQHYPKWYNEGLAEYLSAIRNRRELFDIGLVAKHRRASLKDSRWIPIRKILTAEEYYEKWADESKEMFYAEAWALVHYLKTRPDQKNSFSENMGRYLEFVESGKNDVDAFAEAFGITARELDSEVKRYVSNGEYKTFTFEADKLLPAFKVDVAKLTREQVSLGLAKIALKRGELDRAEHWFTIAEGQELTRPRAEAGLGDVFKFRGDFEAAQPRFEQAAALAPNDPYSQLDFAEYWHYLAMNTKDAADRKEFLGSARNHYVKAWKLDDSTPETYAMYGQTYLMEGNYSMAIEMLEEAESLLPSNLDIRLILTEAYAGAGRNEQATEAARSIVAWSHDEAVTKRVQEILAQLDAKKK
ncbi:MAG: tetratricopeptide repeat protein [Pseudomonadales bacterium]